MRRSSRKANTYILLEISSKTSSGSEARNASMEVEGALGQDVGQSTKQASPLSMSRAALLRTRESVRLHTKTSVLLHLRQNLRLNAQHYTSSSVLMAMRQYMR